MRCSFNREYFGEKIGFYFAWIGLLCATLWIPTIFGLICFFYGLHVRYVFFKECLYRNNGYIYDYSNIWWDKPNSCCLIVHMTFTKSTIIKV